MNRRRFLQGVVTPLSVGAAGCLGRSEEPTDCTDEWSPAVTADEPTLEPGDETTIRVEVSNVVGLRFVQVPLHDDALNVDVASASVSPAPDQTKDSYPPKWYWSECTNAEVFVPVRVAERAEPGEYGYTVRILQSRDGSGEKRERKFTITIADS
jgi:hypothetical protein